MTWLLLWVLGLATTGLTYPIQSTVEPMVEVLEQQQQLIQDEIERNYLAEQEEIIIEDYFLFLKKIGKIKYARWCMGEYTPAVRSQEKQKYVRCSDNAFDCAWLIKWYAIAKGILTAREASYYNSQTLMELAKPKDATLAKRWDFTSRQWFWERWTGNLSTHFAMVSRDYTWGNTLWIYDNVNWKNNNIIDERPIKVAYSHGKFYYLWMYRISVYTNGLVETARDRNIQVERWVDTDIEKEESDNPLDFDIIISWFAYDSYANRMANLRYRWTSWVDIVETFWIEASFNMDAVWWKWELWVCQLLPGYNKVFITDPKRKTPMGQAELCLQKRLLVTDKSKIRSAYKIRKTYSKKIIYLKK